MEEAQFDELRGLDAFAATMAAIGATVPLGPIAQACPGLMKALLAIHPVKAAATFGGLLTQKRLQPNCLRLEALVHLCVAAGNGKHALTFRRRTFSSAIFTRNVVTTVFWRESGRAVHFTFSGSSTCATTCPTRQISG